MKLRATTPAFKLVATKSLLFMSMAVIVTATPIAMIPQAPVSANQAQIDALEQQVSQYNDQIAQLNKQALSLENELAKLSAQKSAIQNQIELTQVKYEQLKQQIVDTKQKIVDNQDALGTTLADMYVDTSISPLEMLASSSNIGDYVDKQSYRSSINEQLQSTITKISDLKKDLESQQLAVEATLNDQKNQRTLLVSTEAQQAGLLARTKGDAAEFTKMAADSRAQIDAQKAAMLAAQNTGGGMGGSYPISSGYPFANASMEYNDYCNYANGSSGADPWGYCKRQCVSYVAWKLANDGRGNSNFAYHGNAIQWVGTGRGYVPTSQVQAGDVVVWLIGGYGHVVYVESVSGGMVNYTQANYSWDGLVTSGSISVGALQSGPYAVERYH